MPDNCTEKILPPEGSFFSFNYVSPSSSPLLSTHMYSLFMPYLKKKQPAPAKNDFFLVLFKLFPSLPSFLQWQTSWEKKKRGIYLFSFCALLILISSPIHYHLALTQRALALRRTDLIIVKSKSFSSPHDTKKSVIHSIQLNILLDFVFL